LRGLVEHQQPRSQRHAEGDLDPTLIAVRKIADKLVRTVLQAELLENGASATATIATPPKTVDFLSMSSSGYKLMVTRR
jgi:hypothetical protein